MSAGDRCPTCQHVVLTETTDVLTLTLNGASLAEVTIFHGVNSGFVAVAHDHVEITRINTSVERLPHTLTRGR